jgi:hypothetical protein
MFFRFFKLACHHQTVLASHNNYFSRLKTLFPAGGHGWWVLAGSEVPLTTPYLPDRESSQKRASMFFFLHDFCCD